MSINIINQVAFLRTTREFPEEPHQLSVECNKAYLDTANVVNVRTIGIFTINRPILTGEGWFLTNQKQNSFRQVYTFGTIAPGASLSIPYKANGLVQFSKIYGTCITNIPDYRPIPYASVTVNANIELRVNTSNIIISNGAASPTLNSGIIIIEWIVNV